MYITKFSLFWDAAVVDGPYNAVHDRAGPSGAAREDCTGHGAGQRNAFTCSAGADLGRAAEKPVVADR